MLKHSNVNRERIAEIRDYLLTVPEDEFDMLTWGNQNDTTGKVTVTCLTPACLAGHICAYYSDDASTSFVSIKAADILGLNNKLTHDLFMPKGINAMVMREATPKDAAKVLDNYLETGKFDWRAVLGIEPE